jgi:cytochrome c-type biogenesis protein CcmF
MAVTAVLMMGLIYWRRAELYSDAKVDSLLSREGAFMLNNWLLLGATFAVLWGTVFPTLSEALGTGRVAVEQVYFNRIMAPIGLLLLALTGVAPLLSWRRVTWSSAWKAIRLPALWALAFSPLLWFLSQWRTGAATAFTLALFVFLAIGWEFVRGTTRFARQIQRSFRRDGQFGFLQHRALWRLYRASRHRADVHRHHRIVAV